MSTRGSIFYKDIWLIDIHIYDETANHTDCYSFSPRVECCLEVRNKEKKLCTTRCCLMSECQNGSSCTHKNIILVAQPNEHRHKN